MVFFRVIFFLWAVSACFSSAQGQEVIYSQYDKFDYRNDDYAIVGKTDGLLYTYRSTSEGAMLDAFDDSMNKVAMVLLDFFPSRIYQVRFIAYPDKIVVIYQALESNKVVQYAALLDNKGRLVNRPIELGSVKTGIFGATKTYFQSTVSENKKWILIYSAGDKGESIEFEGKWLDDRATIVKRSHVTFKADNTIEHGEVNISNDGTLYMAGYTPVGTQNYADQFWIFTLQPGGSKFEPKEMQLNEKFAASGYMKVDNVNGHVYFGGFYSDKKNGSFDGIIYADYEIGKGAFTSHKFIPFDESLLSIRAKRRKDPLDNFQVRQLIVKNDGGFVLISEAAYVTTRSNYMPGFGYYSFYSPYTTSMVHEYHYEDIMALAYDKEGVREWSAFIPKDQYSQEDGGVFSSYALLNTGGALAFLYNDFNAAHSRIQLASLESDGKTDIRSFTAEGNDYPDWLPRSGKQVAARELIVPCFHKKQICFARVVF
ncbi:MAG: hypothetical protein V4649_03265 [Bacteroidota bacterium]